MSSRRKGKKSNKGKSKSDDTEKVAKQHPYAFFTQDEITQIKNAFKVKEVCNIPIGIGCVILNKLETLENAVKNGLDVNELGPNNTTALIWAVRYQRLDLIDFLLKNGADHNIKVDNGESIIIVALEHKLWDEQTFIKFWNMMKNLSPVDVNSSNKNGHTILHIAVRREWEEFIEILLKEKVIIDITNINGVTPLMTACFRNNLKIVNTLINSGADFTKEDNHFRTALCYAIVTGFKLGKPPFLIAERIIFELKKDLSFKEYIKRRMQIIDLVISKDKVSEAESEMLVTLTQYIVQYTENGLKIILDLKIFESLEKALKQNLNEEKGKLLLLFIQELLCYNEQINGYLPETHHKLTSQLLESNIFSTCVDIIKAKETYSNFAFYVIVIFCTANELGQKWLRENYEEFTAAIKCLPEDCLGDIQKDFPDSKRHKMMKKKIKRLRRFINTLEGVPDNNCLFKCPEENTAPPERKSEILFNIKKSKRKTKIIKAKVNKIKNFALPDSHCSKNDNPDIILEHDGAKVDTQEFAPELNSLTCKIKISNEKKDELKEAKVESVCGLKELNEPTPKGTEGIFELVDKNLAKEIEMNQQMVNTFMTDDMYCPYYCHDEMGAQNLITDSLKHFVRAQEKVKDNEEPCFVPSFPDWKSNIFKLPFNDWSSFSKQMKIDKKKLKAAVQYMRKMSLNLSHPHNPVNLEESTAIVIEYLKELLDIIINKSKTEWEQQWDEKGNKNGKKSGHAEKQAISELQTNFNTLITSICSLVHSNLAEALRNIYTLESTLLNFSIRGKSLGSEICPMENVKIQYTTFSYEAETCFLSYVENVLNGFEELRDDINITVLNGEGSALLEREPAGLYEQEIRLLSPAKPKNKRKEFESKMKTMENAYHLVDSIEKLVEDEEERSINSAFLKPKTNDVTHRCSDMVLKILTKHVAEESSTGTEKSRWCDKIQQLQNIKHSQLLLGGNVRLGRFPERNTIISQGGNFNFVILGLSTNDQPLAIKKIPREHCVCKVLKSLINPLLSLRNKNILHYSFCDYAENDLILATPLCEYNIGQYVLLLKENADKRLFNLNQMEIVKQFLNGLAFLHQRIEPIVHGNLKPSNIFVDIHGVVRLAEFGINKALFQLIEAPKSSLIWFSQETYRIYKITSAMECSISSDIQVAGMLIYFIVSGGVHPFGTDVTTILKNIEKAAFTLPPTREAKNQIFSDLISWMLMYEPNDRPNIKQILSHVLFWSNDRRWRFILNCSGISTNGVPLAINTAELHQAIDKMSAQEQIKGHWVSITRKKFPQIKCQGEDTVVGLLRFIRHFYENKTVTDENFAELKNCVLTYFPAFPLTLYRILEATGFIKEYPFIAYTMVEKLSM